jgi:propionyl-CoA synthetase
LLSKYDLSHLRTFFVAGERTDPSTFEWLCEILGVPVIDHWWQTESGWPVACVQTGLARTKAKPGSVAMPPPGFDVQIISESSERLSASEESAVVIKLPLPPGCLPTVWGDHERYLKAYLSENPSYYHTGDGGYLDSDGYLCIMGRTDDVINVAGHRLSAGQMEEVVAAHAALAECVLVGIEDKDKGQVPIGMVVIKDGVNIQLGMFEDELVAMVHKDVGAFANFKRIVRVLRLPKIRYGKVLRQVIRKIVGAKP